MDGGFFLRFKREEEKRVLRYDASEVYLRFGFKKKKNAEVFFALMFAYRSKEMENPVMQMIAGRLDDEQIGSLALYFSQLEPSE